MRPIDAQTILITGETSGLGRELAKALADRGATLLLHGRDARLGLQTVREMTDRTGNKNIRFLRADLSSLRELNELSRQVVSSVSRLDVLLNNAGVGFGKDDSKREALENVTGEYSDGLKLARANAQAYDERLQRRLAALSRELTLDVPFS